jgi:hypothetical protein
VGDPLDVARKGVLQEVERQLDPAPAVEEAYDPLVLRSGLSWPPRPPLLETSSQTFMITVAVPIPSPGLASC